MTETCTIKIAYEGITKTITLPKSAEYDDFIAVAMQIFNIHIRFKNYLYIRVVSEARDDLVFKDLFDSLTFIYPEPQCVFYIHIKVTVRNMLEFIYRFGPPKLKRQCIDDGFTYPTATRRRYA